MVGAQPSSATSPSRDLFSVSASFDDTRDAHVKLNSIPFPSPWLLSRTGSYEVTCWALHKLFHEDTGSRSIYSLKEDLSSPELMLAGGIAGCVGWTVMMPMDTVKSSLQRGPATPSSAGPLAKPIAARPSHDAPKSTSRTTSGAGADKHHHLSSKRLESRSHGESPKAKPPPASKPAKRTFLSVSRAIWKEQGYRGFYRGLSLALLRSFPANAALFLSYEQCHRQLTSLTAQWEDQNGVNLEDD